MPVLKTYKNGVWEPVSGMSEHTHTKDDITDLEIFSNEEQIAFLVEEDMIPAVHDVDGKILTDENGNVILRY